MSVFGNNLVDFNQRSLAIAAASIVFNPIFWNAMARREYHHRTLTRLFGGNQYYGCYFLAVVIFSLGILRDHLYVRALAQQPSHAALEHPYVTAAAIALLVVGNVLVLSSMYALGITGTYLGDYFGILMPARVTCFPFNVCAAPMYYGSTMSFLGVALWSAKPTGVLLTAEVLLVYLIALRFEDPFTEGIYKAGAEGSKGGKKAD